MRSRDLIRFDSSVWPGCLVTWRAEGCKNTTVVLEGDILTRTVEVWKCENFTLQVLVRFLCSLCGSTFAIAVAFLRVLALTTGCSAVLDVQVKTQVKTLQLDIMKGVRSRPMPLFLLCD